MTMRFCLLLPVLLCAAGAMDFYIRHPWEATRWKAGDTVTISWTLLDGGPVTGSINIDLMDGADENADVLQNIAADLPASATSYAWRILPETTNSDRVFVRLTGTGTLPIYRYSHRFTIYGGQPPVSSTSLHSFMDPHFAIPTASSINPPIQQTITSFPPVVSLQTDWDSPATSSTGTAATFSRQTNGAARTIALDACVALVLAGVALARL